MIIFEMGKEGDMKFLLMVLAIRYVFHLLDKIGNSNEGVDVDEREETIIHPSEFRTRW